MKSTSLLFLLSFIVYSVHAQTAPVDAAEHGLDCVKITRMEIHDYTPEQRERYISAAKKLMERKGNNPSRYDQLVRKHNDNSETSHGKPPFLPWHRYFLAEYEEALREIDPEVTVPYWAWEEEATSPELSNVFLPDWFGGNGDPRKGNCVQDGPQVGWVPFYPRNSKCLTRKFNRGDRIGAYAPPERIEQVIAENNNYHDFRRAIEGPPHSAVHNGCGAGFKSMYSPNDLVFWLHHGNIDRIWDKWQQRRPQRRYAEYNGPNAKPDYVMKGFDNVRVRDALSMKVRGVCVTYAPPVNIRKKKTAAAPPTRPRSGSRTSRDQEPVEDTVQPVEEAEEPEPNHRVRTMRVGPTRRRRHRLVRRSNAEYRKKKQCQRRHVLYRTTGYKRSVRPDNRSNVADLLYMDEIPEDFLRMNNQDVAFVRREEAAARRLVDQLNALPGYVSPAALINDQTKLQRLSDQGEHFGAWSADGTWVRVGSSNNITALRSSLASKGVLLNTTMTDTSLQSLEHILGPDAVSELQQSYGDDQDTVWYHDAPYSEEDQDEEEDEEDEHCTCHHNKD